MSNPYFVAASVSPTTTSIHDHFRAARHRQSIDDIRRPRILHPLENEGLRLLILENISQDAVAIFRAQGYQVDHFTKAMGEDELVEKISTYHAIGIRSKTKITERVLKAASKVGSLTSLLVSFELIVATAARDWVLLHWYQPG